ncbi:MAG: alginate export family protein [Pseudomonadota bacterium]
MSALHSSLNFAASEPGSLLDQAIAAGSANLDLRYRYESVEQEGFDATARASLLRSRLTLSTANIRGFSATLEVDNVSSVGAEDYNSTENGKRSFPTIADPEGTNFNQGYIRYSQDELRITGGRQRILLGDMRFIGSKPWRQNEQTYDGIRLQWTGASKLSVDASYVNRVNRIFGPDDGANPADWRGDSYFLRAGYPLGDDHSVSAFAYSVDVGGQDGFGAGKTVNNSSDSLGIEYKGKYTGIDLRLAWATQTDGGASELDYRSGYYFIELGGSVNRVGLRAGHEVLGGDNGVGFATPLANGHKYNGWADKFLATPGDGLEDTWVSLSGPLGPVALTARYHDFRAEDSSAEFGSEVDLQAQWKVSEAFTATLKAGLFNSDSPDRFDDTDKLFLILQLKL